VNPYDDEVLVDLVHAGETIVEQVAWAIHCWACPLCNGSPDAMATSGQLHVGEDDLLFASFLVGALGLERTGERNEGRGDA